MQSLLELTVLRKNKITKLVRYPLYSEETLDSFGLTIINISLYPYNGAGPYGTFQGQTPTSMHSTCILSVEKPVSQVSTESQKPDTRIND